MRSAEGALRSLARENALRADFNVADVLRHRLSGAIGIVGGDPCGDFRVVRRALGDQSWLISSSSVEILEVEPRL